MPILNLSSGCNLSCSQNAFLHNLACSVQSGTYAPLFRCICDAEGQRRSTACQHSLGITRKLEGPSPTFVFQEISKFLAHGLCLLFVWKVFRIWPRFGCEDNFPCAQQKIGNLLGLQGWRECPQSEGWPWTWPAPSAFSIWGKKRDTGKNFTLLFYQHSSNNPVPQGVAEQFHIQCD